KKAFSRHRSCVDGNDATGPILDGDGKGYRLTLCVFVRFHLIKKYCLKPATLKVTFLLKPRKAAKADKLSRHRHRMDSQKKGRAPLGYALTQMAKKRLVDMRLSFPIGELAGLVRKTFAAGFAVIALHPSFLTILLIEKAAFNDAIFCSVAKRAHKAPPREALFFFFSLP